MLVTTSEFTVGQSQEIRRRANSTVWDLKTIKDAARWSSQVYWAANSTNKHERDKSVRNSEWSVMEKQK